jgi:hypothetical protein
MPPKTHLLLAALCGAILATVLNLSLEAAAADPEEVPETPEGAEVGLKPEPKLPARAWEVLEFSQQIPLEWGTVFSINRVEKAGESYTFWFLAMDGTLRGVTTREFTGPNRGSFFPEVYIIKRRWNDPSTPGLDR